uniref:U11/U12 small nuclear ribonucleoprotein 35 kDa protein n=1 Tax=Scylla olivacea TaxID=85551 RepID=A0A0P4WFH4_SCYOL
MMSDWRPVARDHYDPLKAGSIDGTDTEPHDRAVWRAMNAHYVPPEVDTKPSHTLFVGRLPHNVDEEQLHHKFSAFGVVEKICLIRDIVTGYSKGYCFVEYRKERDAEYAMRESTGLLINGCPVLVDWEAGHRLKGWVPRRLGGGWGGRKEAGQLRFGCRDRPWKKPIVIHPPRLSEKPYGKDVGTSRSHDRQDRHGSSEDRHRNDFRNKDKKWRWEDRRDRHMYSTSSHKRTHKSAIT